MLFSSDPIYLIHVDLTTLTISSHVKIEHLSYLNLETHAAIVDVNDGDVTLGINGNAEPLVVRISFESGLFQVIKNQWSVYTGGFGGEITAIDTYGNSMAVESLHDNDSQMVGLMQRYYLDADGIGSGNIVY